MLSADDAALQLNDLQWGEFQAAEVIIYSDVNTNGWRLVIGELTSASIGIDQMVLDCSTGAWLLFKPDCAAGVWQLTLDGEVYEGEFSLSEGLESAEFMATGMRISWYGGQQLTLEFEQKSLLGLDRLWSRQTDWPQLSEGVLDGAVQIGQVDGLLQVDWDLQVKDVGFDNAAGDLAAVNLNMALQGSLQQQADPQIWKYHFSGSWDSGEMLFGIHYLPAPSAPAAFLLKGVVERNVDDGMLDKLVLDQISFDHPGVLQLSAAAAWSNLHQGSWRPQTWRVESLQADLAGLIQAYFSGMLGKISLDGMQTSGTIQLTGRQDGAGFAGGQQGIRLQLGNISLIDAQSRFSVSGLDGALNWQLREPENNNSSLSWQQLQIYQLPFEPADLRFSLGGDAFRLQQGSRIGFLDAGLVLHELQVSGLSGGTPVINMDAELLPIDMAQLAAVMGWPSFGGQLAGRIPGVQLSNGVWQLDGQLALEIFDGQVVLSSLSAERPFGVLPNFNASIWLDRVQLEPLTEAFEIGRITGPVDGRIDNLRLLNWQPAQFDAWLRTSADPQVPLRISQRAVDTISSIGGGVGGGLQSTFLRLFEDFGYRRLGFSCRLLNEVCELDGVADSPSGSGFLLVDGSGIPKLEVVGHNRRVDWQQMLEQLKAATKSGGPTLN